MIRRLLIRLALFLTGHHTYCDGCKRFSAQPYCDCDTGGESDAAE